jgi:hypothetical protein
MEAVKWGIKNTISVKLTKNAVYVPPTLFVAGAEAPNSVYPKTKLPVNALATVLNNGFMSINNAKNNFRFMGKLIM